MMIELNSYGELYVILMTRLPMAVLTAGFLVAATRRIAAWWRELRAAPSSASLSPFANAAVVMSDRRLTRFSPWAARLVVGGAAAVVLCALAIQTTLWGTRNSRGFGDWLKTPVNAKPEGYMRELQEALLWVREHTETNAVLVANAFTPENMKKDHWGALDHTLMGVHFYYSALSERRLWFEGPNYILDTTRARLRASLASNFFYRGKPLTPSVVTAGPCYILVDRSLADGAKITLGPDKRVFSNPRIEVYRLSDTIVGD
jgi:hypothetical protein